MKPPVSTKVVIDRIEGNLAVLVVFDDDRVKFNLPVRYLPDGLKDGDHLLMNFREDEASRKSQQKRVDDLLNELKTR